MERGRKYLNSERRRGSAGPSYNPLVVYAWRAKLEGENLREDTTRASGFEGLEQLEREGYKAIFNSTDMPHFKLHRRRRNKRIGYVKVRRARAEVPGQGGVSASLKDSVLSVVFSWTFCRVTRKIDRAQLIVCVFRGFPNFYTEFFFLLKIFLHWSLVLI